MSRRVDTVAEVNCRRCGDGVTIRAAAKNDGYCQPCAADRQWSPEQREIFDLARRKATFRFAEASKVLKDRPDLLRFERRVWGIDQVERLNAAHRRFRFRGCGMMVRTTTEFAAL